MCPKFLKHGFNLGIKRLKKRVVFRLPRDHIVSIRSKIVPFALLAYSSQADYPVLEQMFRLCHFLCWRGFGSLPCLGLYGLKHCLNG